MVDHFVAASDDEKRTLVATGVARPERVTVVWNGIDIARYQQSQADAATLRRELGVPVDAILVTTACRLFKPRDFDSLLRAMRAVVDGAPKAHLLIVGDGPLHDEVVTQIKGLGLTNHVTLAGWRRDMPDIYAVSDLYVLTTWGWEGLPFTLLEAMAAGLPAVASRAGGIPDVIVEGETGFVVDQRNAAALAEAITKMVADPALRTRAGEAGRVRAETYFALPLMVKNMIAVYEQALGK
jgi:glycosyltransferase involved in cell wall biosynthesis